MLLGIGRDPLMKLPLATDMNRLFPRITPTPETVAAYEQVGGTPHLDFRHTVFGQVYAGIEVVDAIANVKTGRNDKPVEDVVILGIDVQDYA